MNVFKKGLYGLEGRVVRSADCTSLEAVQTLQNGFYSVRLDDLVWSQVDNLGREKEALEAKLREANAAATIEVHPSTLNPTPYTLNLTPYTLQPTPYTLHPTPYTLQPTPSTLIPQPSTLNPNPQPSTLNPQPYRGTSLIKQRPTPLGPSKGPRHSPSVGS